MTDYCNPEWLRVDRRRTLSVTRTLGRGLRYWRALRTDGWSEDMSRLCSPGVTYLAPPRRLYSTSVHYLKVWDRLVRVGTEITFTDTRKPKTEEEE